MSHTDPYVSLLTTHYEEIYRFCLHFLGSRAEAEDVTQEVFIKAFQSLDSVREEGATRGWLYSIARNCCIDKKRWWKRYLTFLHRGREEGVDQGMGELSLTLSKLISELPERQREIFILRHFHDFSTEDTAQLLNISPGTVKSHLKRAVDSLKKALEKDN